MSGRLCASDSVCTQADSDTTLSWRKKVMSPSFDASEKHLHIARSFGTTTEELVTRSLNNAVASVRSGEVARVNVNRVLHVDNSAPASIAANIQDLTPKRVAHAHAKVLYF